MEKQLSEEVFIILGLPSGRFPSGFPTNILYAYWPAGSVPPPSHLTSCTPPKSNLYFDTSSVTVVSEPAYTYF
jgi:hypothetical protein